MARLKLTVEKRDQLGRKVKHLRAEGILPANVYGRKVKSLSIQLKAVGFKQTYRKVGETGLIDLEVKGEKTSRPVLVHNVQLHPVSDQIIHVDFHQVDLTQKVQASIPVQLVGESPAIVQKLGILVRLVDEIDVEALPTDLPDKIEVQISNLEKVGDIVKMSDIKLGDKVTVQLGQDKPLVKIEPPTKIEEEKPVEKEVEGEGEEVEGEGEAGEVLDESGAKPTQTDRTEEKSETEPTGSGSAQKS